MNKGSMRSAKKKRRDFQKKGLIARNKYCPSCNQAMNMQSGNDVTDQCSLIKMVIKN